MYGPWAEIRAACGISLVKDDIVISADILAPDSQVLTFSEEGFGKQ